MNGWLAVLQREFVYVGYYFMLQLRQIAGYWILGMGIGSLVSVFAKDAIHGAFDHIRDKKWGLWGVIPASLLGIASPLCMYGTIPIAASFSRNGMRDDWLAAFMMSSVLLNPQLIMYSTALGTAALAIRLIPALSAAVRQASWCISFSRIKRFSILTGSARVQATIRIPIRFCALCLISAGTFGRPDSTS